MADTLKLSTRLLDESNGYGGDFADLLVEAAAELDRREARLTALAGYTRHEQHCVRYQSFTSDLCTCGLDAALKG